MKKPHVLIIEDDRILADSIRDLLELKNSKATVVHTAEEGLAFLEKTKVQLVLLDVHLPDMTRYDFLGQAAQLLKKTPVIILTALEHVEEIEKNSGLSRDKIFFKPQTSVTELASAIEREL